MLISILPFGVGKCKMHNKEFLTFYLGLLCLKMKLEISSKNGLHTLYSYYFLLSDNKTFYQKISPKSFFGYFFYHVFTVVEIFWLSRRYSFYSF